MFFWAWLACSSPPVDRVHVWLDDGEVHQRADCVLDGEQWGCSHLSSAWPVPQSAEELEQRSPVAIQLPTLPDRKPGPPGGAVVGGIRIRRGTEETVWGVEAEESLRGWIDEWLSQLPPPSRVPGRSTAGRVRLTTEPLHVGGLSLTLKSPCADEGVQVAWVLGEIAGAVDLRPGVPEQAGKARVTFITCSDSWALVDVRPNP